MASNTSATTNHNLYSWSCPVLSWPLTWSNLILPVLGTVWFLDPTREEGSGRLTYPSALQSGKMLIRENVHYCIPGNFVHRFNLAIWRFGSQLPNWKVRMAGQIDCQHARGGEITLKLQDPRYYLLRKVCREVPASLQSVNRIKSIQAAEIIILSVRHGRLCTWPGHALLPQCTHPAWALLTSRTAVCQSWASRCCWKCDGHKLLLVRILYIFVRGARASSCLRHAYSIVIAYF